MREPSLYASLCKIRTKCNRTSSSSPQPSFPSVESQASPLRQILRNPFILIIRFSLSLVTLLYPFLSVIASFSLIFFRGIPFFCLYTLRSLFNHLLSARGRNTTHTHSTVFRIA
ncbi:uncharacterized protein F4812DRAFT_15913 [Daldinia caldariorum]|uniref:uncharacterized protein n=1 Tax=Daldinia caldariorum TaxID=326644 RepID=UPI002007D3C0|nr:uncharacterized protein F4812DRAFT_15913 [Daldinia caldariorum]KAI1472524.1 hypothetical protein F4812DRAFT_15913 [Daldinia caldariorum]